MASATKRRRLQPEDYLAGWVCALPIELAAAAEMLDEEHEDILDRHDANIYTLGRMGNHNVVLACLPAGQTGTNSAAVVANQMRTTFRLIQFGLMVGIGGGVPGTGKDIRLGDVVISQPLNRHGGVVQYDLGKTGTGDDFKRTGSLNTPPAVLLNALANLKANHYRERSNIETYMAVFDRLPRFQRQMAGPDVLYQSTYPHTGGTTCGNCDKYQMVQREPRRGQWLEMAIHYGTIAAGNQVMKDGVKRDRLSAELCEDGGIYCFEMEAAGLMNTFPCLVIRGICDYADSHKNKGWQSYASATAAACAKELLSIIPTTTDRPTLTEDRQGIENLRLTAGTIEPPSLPKIQSPPNLEQRNRILESLKFDQIDSRHATIKTAHAKTCKWLLTKSEYKDWQESDKHPEHHGFLWIKGKPGTGKSTLMKFAFANYKKEASDTITVSFFFNARGERLERSVEGMYRSLLWQLLERLPRLLVVLESLQSPLLDEASSEAWSTDEVKNLLRRAVELLDQRLTCFIDALDECDEDEIRDMLSFFEELEDLPRPQHGVRLNVCFSSRHYPNISVNECTEMILEGQEGHQKDMANYLNSNLKAGKSKLVDKIRVEILERASGIFLWVVLVARILQKEYDRGRMHNLRKRLDEIPDGLDDLFKDIMTRDTKDVEALVLCLQWISFARRPLKCEEIYFAVLIGVDSGGVSAWNPDHLTKDDMIRFILDSSKGLAELTKSKQPTVQFIHESVRDYVLKGDGLKHLRLDPRTNFSGQSHDRLKQCCEQYLKIEFSEYFSLDTALPAARSDEGVSLRQTVSGKFPFLEYSVHNILHHADTAAGNEAPQTEFISHFDLRNWIGLDNLLERYPIRRHTPNASMLYILAEQNLPYLLKIELKQVPSMDILGERYKLPLLAAAINNNKHALEVLLTPHDLNGLDEHQRDKAISRLLEYVRDTSHNKLLREYSTSLAVARDVNSFELSYSLVATRKVITECTALSDMLVHAGDAGDEILFQSLIEQIGICFNDSTREEAMDNAFRAAFHNGNTAALRMLLVGGVQVARYPDMLYTASENGREAIVEVLLYNDADVNVVGGEYGTALHAASAMGCLRTVELLLDKGANIHVVDSYWGTALHTASAMGCLRTVELLLDNDADVNVVGGEHGTALQAASFWGHDRIVELLLDNGADANVVGGEYGTALQAALVHGRSRIVGLLRDKGAVSRKHSRIVE